MKLASFAAEGRDRIGVEAPGGALIDIADLLVAARSTRQAPDDMMALIREGEPLDTGQRGTVHRHRDQLDHLTAARLQIARRAQGAADGIFGRLRYSGRSLEKK